MVTNAAGIDLTLNVDGDISGLQGALPGIVQRSGNKSDSCAEVINIHTVGLSPAGSAASLFVAAHYEKWHCAGMHLPEWMGGFPPRIEMRYHETKNKVFEQNGSAQASLELRAINDGLGLQIVPTITRTEFDGLIGVLNTLSGGALNNLITPKILQAVNPENLKQSFPVSLAPYSPRIVNAHFVDLGAGRLGVSVVMTAHVTQAQANGLFGQLMGGLQAKR